MNVTVMCLFPNATDATSLYRGIGPLQSLSRRHRGLRLQLNPEVSWATLKSCDAVFMQRPAQGHHVKIVDLAKMSGVPVWVDYDDDLYGVPPSNPTHPVYGDPKVQNNVSAILAKADVVTASTEFLAARLRAVVDAVGRAAPPDARRDLVLSPEKVVVVPNAYDTELLAPLGPEAPEPKQKKIVAWRGSSTHDKDLLGVTPELCDVMAHHLDWTYNFIGQPFWLSLERFQDVPGIKDTNVVVTPLLDPLMYFQFLRDTRPALMVVPLDDSAFNRAKSNIAWIEATHAGAAVLAPAWEEWRHPGVLNYGNRKEFQVTLEAFLRGEIDGAARCQQSRDHIAETLTLAVVNRRREAVIERLAGLRASRH